MFVPFWKLVPYQICPYLPVFPSTLLHPRSVYLSIGNSYSYFPITVFIFIFSANCSSFSRQEQMSFCFSTFLIPSKPNYIQLEFLKPWKTNCGYSRTFLQFQAQKRYWLSVRKDTSQHHTQQKLIESCLYPRKSVLRKKNTINRVL